MFVTPRTSLPSLPGKSVHVEDGLVPHTIGYHNISLLKAVLSVFRLTVVLICLQKTASRTTDDGGSTMSAAQRESQTTGIVALKPVVVLLAARPQHPPSECQAARLDIRPPTLMFIPPPPPPSSAGRGAGADELKAASCLCPSL